MGKPKAPEPPDPRETAAAQTGTNVSTAVANTAMGNVNQYTPYGSLTYRQTGTTSIRDPNTGVTYRVPTYSSATTLSRDEQRVYDQDVRARTNLAGAAADQSDFLRDYLSTPFTDYADFNPDTREIEEYLGELYDYRMEPAFRRDEDALRTRLTQQGLEPGSAAWNAEMERFGQNRNDARVQTMLQGNNQAFNQLLAQHQTNFNQDLTLRNQPINEIGALLGTGQVQNPGTAPMNVPSQMPTVDAAGLIMDNYRARQSNYQQQMAQRQGILGGMFDLGAAAITASDRRLKADIERIDTRPDGLGVYTFRYKDGALPFRGLMADEVKAVYPGAIVKVGGFDHVDYRRVPQW